MNNSELRDEHADIRANRKEGDEYDTNYNDNRCFFVKFHDKNSLI